MSMWLFWLLLALIALGGEVMTGTLVLLFAALGFGAASLIGWLGLPLAAQLVAASAGALGGWFWLFRRRHEKRKPTAPDSLDLGERVEVLEWFDERRCRVRYRGSEWRGELVGERSGLDRYHVVALDGVTIRIRGE